MHPSPASHERAATSVFALPDHLAAKADPALIGADEQHLADVAACLERTRADVAARLDAARRAPAGGYQQALDRDQEVQRLTARLHALSRSGLDLCLGRMVSADGTEPTYLGRVGLTDEDGRQLLLDWRTPAAEPFFAATHADPRGLASRRRYRWTRGRVSDYWDEVFSLDLADSGVAARAALDDQSAFIASLGEERTPRMRDVLATITADQDAIIRAGSRGALVVDGGPGTGKTVVALHRTAYLLHADPRLGHRRGGVLFVGPHRPYLAYVSDVLPSLGEEGVQTCVLRDLVAEGASATVESDPDVARLKSARLVGAIEAAVALYEEPPTDSLEVTTPWGDVWLGPDDWREAFATPDLGTPHNDARDQVWEALVTTVVEAHDDDAPADQVRRWLPQHRELRTALHRAWPLLEAADLVGDLWTVPAYLERCAPWLTDDEVRALQRTDPSAWTTSDLPLLDAARQRLGDPGASRRRRRNEAALAADRARMADVVDDLIATDDSEMHVMSMLRGEDAQTVIVDDSALLRAEPDRLAGPFAHVVVDEAQELTDAEWQQLLARCPSRSFTVVGDRAQARRGFAESWHERLARVGLDRVEVATLSINYRTPEEVMAAAAPVIRAVLPDANVPTSVRRSGAPVSYGRTADLQRVLDTWLTDHAEGTAVVIARPAAVDGLAPTATDRVRVLTPELSKGLEFDLVVLVDPESFGEGVAGAVDRYVAMTRATQQLVVLTGGAEA